MPRTKYPKKNNGATEPVSNVSPEVSPTNGAVEAAAHSSTPVAETRRTEAAASAASPTTSPTIRKTRKPEIVKTEARSNLVPINVEDEIRQLAYLLSERRGFEPGHETEDWLSAEREVRQRYHQHSA